MNGDPNRDNAIANRLTAQRTAAGGRKGGTARMQLLVTFVFVATASHCSGRRAAGSGEVAVHQSVEVIRRLIFVP